MRSKVALHLGVELVAGLPPDPRDQEEHPVPAHGVPRVGDQPEVRQQVLDVGGLHELEAPELHEGDVVPHQFDFQVEGVVAGPEEHRDRLERVPSS